VISRLYSALAAEQRAQLQVDERACVSARHVPPTAASDAAAVSPLGEDGAAMLERDSPAKATAGRLIHPLVTTMAPMSADVDGFMMLLPIRQTLMRIL
jgi:hypothetical protein